MPAFRLTDRARDARTLARRVPAPVSCLRAAAAAAALGMALLGAPAAQAGPYASLYVFGDSLSDAAGGSAVPLAPNQGGLAVPAPYDGGRFSNGRVAAEYLAGYLGLDAAHSFQYAIGGARSGVNGVFAGTGLLSQVGAFAAVGAGGDYSHSLMMVWAGANDFRDALTLPDPTVAFGGILTNLRSAIQTLYGLGARNFLLPNLPDVGLTPEGLASGASPLISLLANGYNGVWTQAMNLLEASLPGADFHLVDVFSAQHALLDGAPANGLLNLTNGCLIPVAGAPGGSTDCSTSFFVDNIHPTTRVHEALAQAMLSAIPEPGSMLLTGLAVAALLASSARRRATRRPVAEPVGA